MRGQGGEGRRVRGRGGGGESNTIGEFRGIILYGTIRGGEREKEGGTKGRKKQDEKNGDILAGRERVEGSEVEGKEKQNRKDEGEISSNSKERDKEGRTEGRRNNIRKIKVNFQKE